MSEHMIMEFIIGSLFTAIATLWALVYKNMERTKSMLDDCTKSHEKANQKILQLTERIGHLEGQCHGINKLADQIVLIVRGEHERSSSINRDNDH